MKKTLVILFTFFFAATKVNAGTTEYFNLSFWNRFNDDALIENLINVYQNNNDLKAAVLKVNEANRVVKMSFANELPHVGFEGYVGHVFHSSDEKFGHITIYDYTQGHYLFPITMNYEVDIWGKNHLRTKSKKKQLEIIKQDEKSAYIYMSSAFATDYYNLIRIDKLIEYQKQLITLQEQIINSYEIRYKLGTATLSDIDKAEKQMTFLKEELQKLSEKQVILKSQMSVLISDKGFDNISRTDFDKIDTKISIPESISYEILEQRPDRIKSQLDMERIGIDVKVAKRNLLPKFVITGDIGFNMYSISSTHKFLADIGIVPTFDLFMGGRKIQMLKLQKDKYDIAVQHYEKTILTSIQESNDALYSLKNAENIKNITNIRLKTDEKEMSDTIIKENTGIADNLDLMIQEQRVITSKKQSVSAKINEIISAINLYQALGGVDFMNSENI